MIIEKTKNATRNIIVGLCLKVYQIVLPFVMRTAIIYKLGMQYVGLNSLFTSILQVLNLAELGVGSAMIFSMYKPIADNDSDTICALMKLYKRYYRIIGSIVAVGGLAVMPFLTSLVKMETVPEGVNIYVLYILNLGATVISYWLFAYKNCLLIAHQRTDISNIIVLLTSTAQYVLQLIVLVTFGNYYLFIAVLVIMQAVNNVITAKIVTRCYPNYRARGNLSSDKVATINKRIRDLFTGKISSVVIGSGDTIVISAFLGLSILAIYQNYYYIMNAVVQFITIILLASIAGIGNSLVTESNAKINHDFLMLFILFSGGVNVSTCCLFILYQPFMKIWVGTKYMLSISHMILMCIYFFIHVINQYLVMYKDAAGLWKEDKFRPLAVAVVNLALNLSFVSKYGLFAVILSTVISYIAIGTPWLIWNLSKYVLKTSARTFLFYLFRTVVSTLASCLVSFLISIIIPSNGAIFILPRLFISLIIGTISFVIFFRGANQFPDAIDLVDRVTKHKFTKLLVLTKREYKQ